MQLYAKYYVIYTHSIVKYGIMQNVCLLYGFIVCFQILLMQNASPLHPIVIDTLMNFQHRGQLSFAIFDESERDTQPAIYDEFGAFRIFWEQVSMEP